MLLIEMINNDIDVNGTTQKEYAHIAGVAEPTITRFKNRKANLGFDSILSIIKQKFPDREQQLMTDYMLSQDNQNARISLEYCMINQLPVIADQLIERLKSSNYSVNKEWAKVYEIERMRNKKEILPLEVIARVHRIDAKNHEMKILTKLLEVYGTYDQSNYTYLNSLIIGLEAQIEECKSLFMKRFFKLRLGQALSYIASHNNEIDTSRYYANMILENTDIPFFRATANQTLGRSYLYESLEKSLSFLKQAENYYIRSNREVYRKVVLSNINFVKCYWEKENTCNIDFQNNKTKEQLDFHDIGEIAFYEIKSGNIHKAKELLNTIDITEETDLIKAFYYYYMALAYEDDVDLYYDSIRFFHRCGEKFYIRLPLNELKRLGERESIFKIFLE
jgi:hypothetical protein